MKWQGMIGKKKMGHVRTDEDKKRVEPYYTGVTWVEVPDEEEKP